MHIFNICNYLFGNLLTNSYLNDVQQVSNKAL